MTSLTLLRTGIGSLTALFLFGRRPVKRPIVESLYCTALFLVGQKAVLVVFLTAH